MRNDDNRFDISLEDVESNEQALNELFSNKKLELKTEKEFWLKSGNVCIELESRGKPSGLTTTEADYWFHELTIDGKTLCYLTFPTKQLKIEVLRIIKEKGLKKVWLGDDKTSGCYLIPIVDLLHLTKPKKE